MLLLGKDAETLNSDTLSPEMNQPILRIISAFFKPFSQMLTLSPIRSGFSTLDRSSQAVMVLSLRTLGGGSGKLQAQSPTPSSLSGKPCVLGRSVDRVEQEMSFLPWLLCCSWGQCAPRALSPLGEVSTLELLLWCGDALSHSEICSGPGRNT